MAPWSLFQHFGRLDTDNKVFREGIAAEHSFRWRYLSWRGITFFTIWQFWKINSPLKNWKIGFPVQRTCAVTNHVGTLHGYRLLLGVSIHELTENYAPRLVEILQLYDLLILWIFSRSSVTVGVSIICVPQKMLVRTWLTLICHQKIIFSNF